MVSVGLFSTVVEFALNLFIYIPVPMQSFLIKYFHDLSVPSKEMWSPICNVYPYLIPKWSDFEMFIENHSDL